MQLLKRNQARENGMFLSEHLIVLALVVLGVIGVFSLFGRQLKEGMSLSSATLAGETSSRDKGGDAASLAAIDAQSAPSMSGFNSAPGSSPGTGPSGQHTSASPTSCGSPSSRFLSAPDTKWASAAAYQANAGDVVNDKHGNPLWKVASVSEDGVSGFRSVVLEPLKPGGRPVVAFAGTGGHSFASLQEAYDWVADLGTDALQLLAVPTQYEEAKREVARLKAKYPDLVVAGHSLGGGMAVYAGMLNGLDVATVNPAQLGVESQFRVWLNAPENAAKNVCNYLNNEFVGNDLLPLLTQRYGEDCYFDSKSGILGRYTRHSLDNTDTDSTLNCE